MNQPKRQGIACSYARVQSLTHGVRLHPCFAWRTLCCASGIPLQDFTIDGKAGSADESADSDEYKEAYRNKLLYVLGKPCRPCFPHVACEGTNCFSARLPSRHGRGGGALEMVWGTPSVVRPLGPVNTQYDPFRIWRDARAHDLLKLPHA